MHKEKVRIEIDCHAGFCSGVVRAIKIAEKELEKENQLYCLGEIVHNKREIQRLEKKGLNSINRNELSHIKNSKVLLRAHGEPPETYEIARQNNITLIDATCPVVLRLQEKIRRAEADSKSKNAQVVIFGKKNHAEVISLAGQTNNQAIIINGTDEILKIDFERPVILFSQTTKQQEEYEQVKEAVISRFQKDGKEANTYFNSYETICRQVSNRQVKLEEFSQQVDVLVFVSSKNSSNGRMLFSVCKKYNKNSFFVSNEKDLQSTWFQHVKSIGISGATSTPYWLMEKVKYRIERII
ncbi:4-hydroxy-3-methylbut-2-enyl diphosphate reductase [Bacteroidota bacterium]